MRARIWIADKSANFATEMTQGKLMTGIQQVKMQQWNKFQDDGCNRIRALVIKTVFGVIGRQYLIQILKRYPTPYVD